MAPDGLLLPSALAASAPTSPVLPTASPSPPGSGASSVGGLVIAIALIGALILSRARLFRGRRD